MRRASREPPGAKLRNVLAQIEKGGRIDITLFDDAVAELQKHRARTRRRGEGRVVKPKGCRQWFGVYKDVNGDTRRVPFGTDYKKAEAKLDELVERRDNGQGNVPEPKETKLEGLWPDFEADLRRRKLSSNTLKLYRCVRRFWQAVGAEKVSDLNADAVNAYMDAEDRRHVSGTTQKMTLQRVRLFLEWAVRNGKVTRNPLAEKLTKDFFKGIRTEPVHERRALRPDELRELLTCSPEKRKGFCHFAEYETLWMLYGLTGARKNELLGICWRDVHLDEGEMHIQKHKTVGSTHKPRVLYFGPRVKAVLDAMKARPKFVGPDDPVVLNYGGTGPRKDSPRPALVRCCKAAGIDLRGVDLAALRKTFGTLVVKTGANFKTVEALLGHKPRSTASAHYVELDELRVRETVAAVEELVLGEVKAKPNTADGQEIRVA